MGFTFMSLSALHATKILSSAYTSAAKPVEISNSVNDDLFRPKMLLLKTHQLFFEFDEET